MGEPAFDMKECQQRGLTYCAPLRAKVRLVIMDREASKPTVKEVKEQEVYMGEIPLMTPSGSFMINGTERVIVSQLHRSPGVFFEHDRGKTHSSGKLLFSARIIPYRGSWLDFEFDPKDILYFRVDRRRKMPATILLRALGFNPESDPRDTSSARIRSTSMTRASSSNWCLIVCAARLRVSISAARMAKSIVAKDKRITAKHVRELDAAGVKMWAIPAEFVMGRVLAHDVIDQATGGVWPRPTMKLPRHCWINSPISGAAKIQTLYINDLDQGPYISQTLRIDEIADQQAARVAIYRMMRPGEPPTEDAVEALFQRLFFNPDTYDLSSSRPHEVQSSIGP